MHPTRELDDLIHQRVRLGILAVLQEVERADFVTLADLLGLTAGNLSRNLTVLEEHGYVVIQKTFEGRRPRTWVQATSSGEAALDQEVRALRGLLDRLEGHGATGDASRPRPEGGSALPATS